MLEYIKILMTDYIFFTCIVAFLLGIITDIIWSMWSISISKKHALTAANLSIFIYLVGIIYTLLIIEAQIIPICLYLAGGWIGTYLAVKKSNKEV